MLIYFDYNALFLYNLGSNCAKLFIVIDKRSTYASTTYASPKERSSVEHSRRQPLYSDVARSKNVSKSQHETKGSLENKHENNDSVGKRSQDTHRRNAIFKGVTRRRIQRIVLYNVDASESIESVTHELTEYAAEYGVKVTSTRLLKEYKSKNWSSYMISVNLDGRDFHKIEHNSEFWPDGITWRKWIPRSQRDRRYDADDAYRRVWRWSGLQQVRKQ